MCAELARLLVSGATEAEALTNITSAIHEYLEAEIEPRGGPGSRNRGGGLTMPKMPGVNHLDAVRAMQRAGF